MKTFTPPPITGYRALTEQEVVQINAVKAHGENLAVLVDAVKALPGIDARWLAIGQTDLQKGLMAITRAIARPTTF
ncbi:MAG: hypothetical protein LCH73_02845 [Proteobacteria bacterium]|nr:hypothetical protein [Pseudomonadota bacterium]